MKFVFASDSFKGTLSSREIHTILSDCAHTVFPEAHCISLEVGDGGEGTVEALSRRLQGHWKEVIVADPLFRPHKAHYFLTDSEIAVMEMAQASGYALLSDAERNPLLTSTYGTGQMMIDAIESGAKEIFLGIGGSATNDGGIGMLSALGVKFLNRYNTELSPNGTNLSLIESIDISGLDKRLSDIKITVMCDVNNPLVGSRGATAVYGPQKGATPEMLSMLEAGMRHYLAKTQALKVLKHTSDFAGAGAAGGLGYALKTYLNAKISSGIETVLSLLQFESIAHGADYIITGEGRIDSQSSQGKLIGGILKVAQRHSIPVIALVGDKASDLSPSLVQQFNELFALTDFVSKDEAIHQSHASYRQTALRLFTYLYSHHH